MYASIHIYTLMYMYMYIYIYKHTTEDKAAEESGGEPGVDVLEHSHDWIAAERQHLSEALPDPQVGRIEEEGLKKRTTTGLSRHERHQTHYIYTHLHIYASPYVYIIYI